MSVLTVFPTLNCVYIGRPDRPLNAPRHAPGGVRNYLAQVAELTEPAEIVWHLDPSSAALTPTIGEANGLAPTVVTCWASPSSADADRVADPIRLRQRLRKVLNGAMRGRTLHVVPFASGDQLGVLATDHLAVVRSVAEIASIGDEALCRISAGEPWRTIVHCLKDPEPESHLVRFADSGETWAHGPHHDARMLLDLRVPATV